MPHGVSFKKKESYENSQEYRHPILLELLDRIDLIVKKSNQEVILKIIVAGYLDDSEETEKRILEKVNNYLAFINDEEFIEEFGAPSYETTHIVLSCAKKPSSAIFDIVKSIEEQVKSYNASIAIEYDQSKS